MKRLLAACLLLAATLAAPAFAEGQFKVLVVAIPNRYHNDYAVVAKPQFERMAQVHAFDLDWRWNTTPFDGDLSAYAAIVLLNTPGDELKGAQRAALESYVRAGGGVVAVHRALIFNPPGEWPWFEKLVGRTFRIHPMVQTATVRVEDPSFPAAFGLPSPWIGPTSGTSSTSRWRRTCTPCCRWTNAATIRPGSGRGRPPVAWARSIRWPGTTPTTAAASSSLRSATRRRCTRTRGTWGISMAACGGLPPARASSLPRRDGRAAR